MKEKRYIISGGFLGGEIDVDDSDVRPGRTTNIAPPPALAGKMTAWDGSGWVQVDLPVPAPFVPQPHAIDTDYFLATILTATELEAVLLARKTNLTIERLLYLLDQVETVKLDGPIITELLAEMETLLIIDATRTSDITAVSLDPESRSRRDVGRGR